MTMTPQNGESDKTALFKLEPVSDMALLTKSMLSVMECQDNSIECERLAREALSLPIKTAWAKMARTWIALADQTDHVENLLREHRTHMP
jgi:hypothetical protein